ncbi:MAG: 16S rRNA (cytosine(1402)-N(4))-methyltransferase RsmH [Rikenellaceae bacterium]
METNYHLPVLLKESVDALDVKPNGIYVDVTFGGGGHSREILSRLSSRGRLIAFDQDADAHANAPKDKRLTLVRSNFRFLRGHLRALGIEKIDGLLGDLGVSSHHFDTPERGFSFRFDAKLDMRMNQSGRLSAADVLNSYSKEDLARLFGKYGELEKPMRMAADVVSYRETVGEFEMISDLQKAVIKSTPKFGDKKFYAKLFQALRIEVNGEMEALEMMLDGATRMLGSGGRLSVITYHSLEDRMVKNYIRSGNSDGKIEKDFFGNILSPYQAVNRKPIEASEQEVEMNGRARSARLRIADKR